MLGAMPGLRALSLAGLALHDAGWSLIRDALSSTPLTSLNLSNCRLGDWFLLFRPPCTGFVATRVTRPQLTPCSHPADLPAPSGEAAGCAPAMRGALRVLDISHNRLRAFPEDLFKQLRSLPAVRSLSVGTPRHGLNVVPPLAMLRTGVAFHLHSLDLSFLPLAKHMHMLRAALAAHAGLTALSMHSAGLQLQSIPDVAAMLRGLPALKHLRLGNNALADPHGRGVLPAALGTLTALELLSLPFCALNAMDVSGLIEHVCGLSRLQVPSPTTPSPMSILP